MIFVFLFWAEHQVTVVHLLAPQGSIRVDVEQTDVHYGAGSVRAFVPRHVAPRHASSARSSISAFGDLGVSF